MYGIFMTLLFGAPLWGFLAMDDDSGLWPIELFLGLMLATCWDFTIWMFVRLPPQVSKLSAKFEKERSGKRRELGVPGLN